MKKLIILFFTAVAVLSRMNDLQAQEQRTVRELADGYYYRQEYAKGLPLWQQLWSKDKNNIGLLERIANSYRQLNNYSKAEEWYALLLNTVPDKNEKDTIRADHYLSYIEVLQNNSKYVEAAAQVGNYLSKGGSNERARILSEGCALAREWMAHTTDYVVREQKAWNTPLADWGTSYYGNQIVFASERGGGRDYKRTLTPFTKLYQTRQDTSAGISVFSQRLDDYRYHVGPVVFNKSLDTLYFTRTNTERAGLQYLRNTDGKMRANYRLELFMQTKQADSSWSVPVPFAYNDARQYSLGHAALSPAGDILYYVSDKTGGYGGTDIYYSDRQADGSWGAPQNCGPVINTFGDEMFPTVMEDGTMYFATDGKPGMGGLDLFYTNGARNQWSNAINLQYPINSAGDDFCLQLRRAPKEELYTGYLSSNRINGTGSDDIYSFSRRVRIMLALNGVITDRKTGQLLKDATVELVDLTTKKLKTKITAADGKYYYQLDKERTYRVRASRQGYESDGAEVSTLGLTATTTITKDLQLTPGRPTIVLRGIYYDFDKWGIREESEPELQKVLSFLHDNPDAIVEIGSHTDSRASFEYNIRLSERRAQSVLVWLTGHGIEKNRLQAKGYGESQPVNGCIDGVSCSEYEYQRNRRTELRVVGGDIDIKSLERFNMHVDPAKPDRFNKKKN